MSDTVKSSSDLYEYDKVLHAKYPVLCGVDEAGRGPLCGPVSCAAVILNPKDPIAGVNDSKKLSEKKREILYEKIVQKALAWKVVLVPAQRIDEINILQATMEGMALAVSSLGIRPDLVLIDGNRIPQTLTLPSKSVVKGDTLSASIAAASILAKVTRDRYMIDLDKQFPQYQLSKHKGYGTALHYELIRKYGIQPFYRKTFLKKLGYESCQPTSC